MPKIIQGNYPGHTLVCCSKPLCTV